MSNREFVIAYFTALWGYPPYEWQIREGLLMFEEGHFSSRVSAPLASGKTALVDFLPLGMRGGHFRRGVHLINRRVLVSEVFIRALAISKKIQEASDGVLRQVADQLRALGGSSEPLNVVQMQGGIPIGSEWLINPAQPTLIVTTTNHFGLRLLFDAPGKRGAKRMHAGLMAYETYVIVDEADSCTALTTTFRAIQDLQGKAERLLSHPLQFTEVSATLDGGVGLEPDDLNHEGLRKRLNSFKRFEAHEVRNVVETIVGLLIRELKAATRPEAYCVFMNTVGGASSIKNLLEQKGYEVTLVTGRMRPLDRKEWQDTVLPFLRFDRKPLDKPLIVVSTQTLEIGVDISFRGILSEACDFRSFSQRSGRCDRIGTDLDPFFFMVGRPESSNPDPVYGEAAYRTLRLLIDRDVKNVGYVGLMECLDKVNLSEYNTPQEPPPILTTVGVDALASQALVKPSTLELLHGTKDDYDVQIVWRSDLDFILLDETSRLTKYSRADERTKKKGDLEDICTDLLEHCPPTEGECLTVPIYAWKQWVRTGVSWINSNSPDLEGWTPSEKPDQQESSKVGNDWCIVWKVDPDNTRKRLALLVKLDQVEPGDVIILPSSKKHTIYHRWGDLAERSSENKRPILRLNPSHLWGLTTSDLETLSDSELPVKQALDEVLSQIVVSDSEGAIYAKLLLGEKNHYARRCHSEEPYYVVCSSKTDDPSEVPVLVLLQDHLDGVSEKACECCSLLGLQEDLRSVVIDSGGWHDWGKAGRFQKYLKGSAKEERNVAKTLEPIRGWREQTKRRNDASLPENFRHEWVSTLFFMRVRQRPTDPSELLLWKLTRHLILTHHGYFAPMPRVVAEKDGNPKLLTRMVDRDGIEWEVMAESTRIDDDLIQSYVDLQLVYGYWGLCYLETLLRSADWRDSAEKSKRDQ